MILGGINRAGAMPAFLRTPTMIQPHLDMKPFLQFPMDTAPPQHSMGLFHNFNTMDPVQKAVINHTFGIPLVKTKRPIISCNVCQIRFNSESQAEAHYKGNRHARRVKGIETSKSRPQEGDKSGRPVSLTSPSLPGEPPTSAPDISDPCNPDEPRLSLPPLLNGGPLMAPPGPLPPLPPLSTHDSPLASSVYPMLTTPTLTPSPLLPSSSDYPVGFNTTIPEQSGVPLAPVAPGTPAGPETEEDKVKKLLYCSLCKVSVNSLSQLEAHNKGTKHKTILEARSGLGPIKAYPRLGPKPPGELGGGPLDPNTEERTFHCEICNVRVNSELQLKQHISSRRHRDGVAGKPNPLLSRHKKHRVADLTSSLNFSKDLSKCLGAGLLPSPLAVAAAMAAAASSNHQLAQLRAAAASSAQHHPHHHHHHLLQGPPLSHAILRPAPGPMRTSHVPILFSPY
ncbi:zinc finger protein 385A-like [Oncorhynchus mykiss]|nr:zinc finger protein 385A-like [Oncorhynchus mykiss]